MAGNRIDLTKARRISQETFDSWTRRLRPRQGDLLLAREAPVGPIVQIPEAENVAPGQRTVLLRPNPDIANSKYLYYLLSSPRLQEAFKEKAAGSTVSHLNVADVRAFSVCLPTLRRQRAVAAVLDALDDKIAANLRINASVQELTACMFSATAAGLVQRATFDDICEVGGGGTPRTSVAEYWQGEVPWVTPTDVTALAGPYIDTTSRRISEAGLAACSSPLYPQGSILMTSRATIGAFAVASRPMAVNQGFIVVNPHDASLRWWIFHEMRSRVDEFVAQANGATFLELSRGKFKKLGVRLAEEPVMRRFNDQTAALHAVARNALAECGTLAELRDALLPQLMSGRLRVRDAEKQVEGVV